MVKKAAQATPNELLIRARLERGWTQKDVADRIGAPLNLNVNRWERGTAKPSAYYVQRLCEVFGKSASELGLLPPQLEIQGAATSSKPGRERMETPEASGPPLKTLDMHLWNVPFRRNPFFTGRASLLERLHEQLNRAKSAALSQSLALSGLGGIGKTQTAIEYAYRYRDEYQAIFWVRAASRETLVADYIAIARLLSLPGQDAQDQMQIVAATKRWLEQHEGWLLILDNADALSLLSDFLPDAGQDHLLLTTRAQATGKVAQSLSVEKMEFFEGMQLLLRRAKLLAPDESQDNLSAGVRIAAQQLVTELDGLPLALDQAGAYIEETACSLAEYQALYRHHHATLLNRQSSLSADYPHTVASTWSLSFQQVEQESAVAAELLRLCAFLDPDAIPEAMLKEGAQELGPVLEPVVTDSFLLNEAIQVLRRYSLIKRDPEARVLNVHRLVQVVLKAGLDEQVKRQWAERTVRSVNAAFPEASFDAWARCERYLPHVHACAELLNAHHLSFPEAARLLHQAGVYLRERGLYGQAEPLLQGALTIRKQVLGAEHADIASSLKDLAELYWYLGKYDQAEPLFQHVVTIREKVFGPTHPDVAEGLNDLAVVYSYQSKYEQAEPLFQRALAIREQMLQPTHPDVAEGLNNLAVLYRRQGKYEQAEPLFQRALSIWQKALGPEHPRVAESLDNLAILYRYQGKYEQAEPLHQEALKIFERVLGFEHPDTAIAFLYLAQLYQLQNRYERAESLYQRALMIFEHVLGPEHLRVAQCLHELARFYTAQDKYDQAKPLYERALSIREQVLGPEHADTTKVREDYTEMFHTMQEKRSITLQQEEEKVP